MSPSPSPRDPQSRAVAPVLARTLALPRNPALARTPALPWAPALPPPQGLLLDAMGTLIGLRQSVGHTYAALAADHGLTVAAEAIDAVFPRIHCQAPPLAFPGLDGAALEAAERHWWADRIAAALAAVGVEQPMPPGLSDALFDRFAEADLWMVYDHVAGALERWHRRGLRLAVVSNFDGRLIGLLRDLGLADWISVVVVSSAAGAAKPDPAPFALALDQLGLSPAQAWHVGDSPEDGLGAQAAGLAWVRIRRP